MSLVFSHTHSKKFKTYDLRGFVDFQNLCLHGPLSNAFMSCQLFWFFGSSISFFVENKDCFDSKITLFEVDVCVSIH